LSYIKLMRFYYTCPIHW